MKLNFLAGCARILKPVLFTASLLIVNWYEASAQLGSQQIKYLSGRDNRTKVQWDFYCTGGRKSGYWTKIAVPSCWEQQGFGAYNYGRDYKTYGKNFRFADEQGIYKLNFAVPKAWANMDVYLVFEGSMTDTEVKINGKATGEKHQGAFYEFKYNISNKLKFGSNNLLEARVSKMSADASVNNAERLADYWVFGGIFRPVYLAAYPKQHISHIAIDAKANGDFKMQVYPEHLKQNMQVVTQITDLKGKLLKSMTANVRSTDSVVNIAAKVNNPLQWTSETPNLYKVNVALKSGGSTIYQTTEKFGFRTIEIRKGDGIYINGVNVKMKGINRHSWWPETGRTLNDDIQLMDVKLMKEMNMNAVRMSHYPPDKKFLEICDSLGLYVLDELAGWQKAYSTAAGKKLVKEMVLRDENHPSIIFWDNGNEGGTNKELDQEFVKYDFSKRPVIHPHHKPGNAFNGIDCNHYEDYYSSKNILNDSLIYMPTEFLHAQDDGGGGTAMADFWDLHWKSKRSGGGFIWALVDEGIVRTDQNNIVDVNGVNAPDGVLGPHREKEGSFFALREIFSPVHITMKDLPANFNGTIPVENRFHYTNLNQCTFNWELIDYRKPNETDGGYITKKKGTLTAPSIVPVAAGNMQINLPTDWKSYDALTLSAYDPFKNLLYRWVWKNTNERLLNKVMDLTGTKPVQVTETDSTLLLKAGTISMTFNKRNGQILSMTGNTGDNLSFGSGPMPVSGTATFKDIRHRTEADGELVEVTYTGDMKYARWKMFGSGWVSLDYEYDLPKGDYPYAGITFTYPENFVLGAKWLGKGPYRVWKNRLQGVVDNVWENAYNNTQTGSAPWIFPEFKGYFADIAWMEFNTVEGKFVVAAKEPNLYVRLFDFYGLSGIKPFPSLPSGNLSFLDAIPAMGTKLGLKIDGSTAKLGPLSEANHLGGTTKRTLYFYFGLLEQAGKNTQQFTRPVVDELFDSSPSTAPAKKLKGQ
ncbi:glycoside hydrolase family 2 TIM barrel-domain containing protein [Mucilaginibacter galii]|uniref:beta-galactosidase n=1 Tax=Mucilaginibacter galii TaxID=2005073 RepID=A0A917J7D4_9SPHI|nr:glycoside hydrolase family 2 TIM barrel-domain containing protein [Mucilaginibacter galii]GGI50034.1 beta-galactosidase [Mucilaginibacter galii]